MVEFSENLQLKFFSLNFISKLYVKGWGKILKNPQESMSQNCSVSNASKSINNQKSLLKKYVHFLLEK